MTKRVRRSAPSCESWTGYQGETDRWAICDLIRILEAQELSMRVARVCPEVCLVE